MATHGDAGWIAASLDHLLPPNLKQRAGFAQKVEAAIQVSEVVVAHKVETALHVSERKKYLANFEVFIRHLRTRMRVPMLLSHEPVPCSAAALLV